jgi:hypothetical protein
MRIKIVDGNNEYLADYGKIMKRYGLTPHINYPRIFVRAAVNYNFAKKLKSIKAFKNNIKNSTKLNFFILSRTN